MYKNLKVASKVPGKGRSLLIKGKQATVFQKDRGEHETRGLSGEGDRKAGKRRKYEVEQHVLKAFEKPCGNLLPMKLPKTNKGF